MTTDVNKLMRHTVVNRHSHTDFKWRLLIMEDNKLKMNLQMFGEGGETDPEGGEAGAGEKGSSSKKDDEGKTLTQEEANRIIAQQKSKAKDEARKELEAEFEEKMAEQIAEAERLAKLNDDDRKEEEMKMLQEELAELKKKDAFYGLSKEASKMLAEQNIQADDEVLQFVVKDDAEGTQQAVNSFTELINRKVEEGVQKALSGTAPRVTGKNNVAITLEDVKKMSADEINKNWEQISKIKK